MHSDWRSTKGSGALTLLSIFVSSILPVFLVAGVGFALARVLRIGAVHLSHVTFNALAPCLVFDLLLTASVGGADVWRLVLFCLLMTATMGTVAGVGATLLRLDRPTRAGFMLVVMFSNDANYGLPLVLFAFGGDALVFATVYFVTSAVLTYTVGVLVASSGHRTLGQALVRVVKVPTIYGAVAAGVLAALAVSVPALVMRPISLLSDAAVPMMLLVLGMQLAQAERPTTLPVVTSATVARLLVAPVLAFAGAELVGLSGAARQAAILQVLDSGRRHHDDSGAGVWGGASLRDQRGRHIDGAQPRDTCTADRVAAVGGDLTAVSGSRLRH